MRYGEMWGDVGRYGLAEESSTSEGSLSRRDLQAEGRADSTAPARREERGGGLLGPAPRPPTR